MGLTISGTQTVGVHLTSASQNPVSVTSTGAIITTGSYALLGATGISWSIINDGTLSASGGFGTGLVAGVALAGGTVSNGSAADTAALISGFNGVKLSGYGTVLNSGTITGANVGYTAGVYLYSGGNVVNGTNNDTTALITGFYGARIGGHGTVVNYGTISSRRPAGSAGVFLQSGLVVNGSSSDKHATIYGGSAAIYVDGTVVNYGSLTGNGGVRVVDGPCEIFNKPGGTISGIGPGISISRYDSNGTANYQVTNAPGAVIQGANGISIYNGTDTITNCGTIRATGTAGGFRQSGVGVYLYAIFTKSRTLTNAGTIIGNVGTAVLFKGGDGRLIVDPGAVFIGGVTASSTGANTLELAAGGQTGVLSAVGRKFINFGTITVDAGARWRLSGTNTLAGGSTIADDGVLLAKGSVAVGGDLTFSGTGVLAVTSTGEIEVGAKGHAAPGRLVVDGGRALVGTGTVRGPITVSGQLRASGGTLTLAGNAAGHGVIGAGAVEIDSGSVLIARNELRERHVVFLAGTNETLGLASPGKATATISGFGTTDTIDLLGITATGSFANGILTLTGAHGGHAALHFAGSYTSGFTIGSDGHGGTAITVHA